MDNKEIIELCYENAVQVLIRNSQGEGFIASSSTPHYAAIWSRDACITSIGANLTGISELIETSKSTLYTLSTLQAPTGPVPTVYWPKRCYWDWGEAGSTDSSAWFVIAAWHYYRTTHDKEFLRRMYPFVQKAFAWLSCQDATNFGLVESPEAGDWMDSTLNRCGKVMYVNALYYWAALALAELGQELGEYTKRADPSEIRFKFNLLFWPSANHSYSELLRHVGYPPGTQMNFPHQCSVSAFQEATKSRHFYLSHVAYGKYVDVCDVLGNSLAMLVGLADSYQRDTIMGYFIEKKVAYPYPAKALSEPIVEGRDYWGMLKSNIEKFQPPKWRNPPFCFHNAGVWPFIGGFYVLAVLKCNGKELASTELLHLADANRAGKTEWEFREWLNGKTAKPGGAAYQSWSAGAYLMAYKAVKEGLSALQMV